MVRKGMDEGSPRDGLKEIRDLLDEDEPDLGGEVDFNFLINNEESDEDYAYGNLESNNDEQEREGSTSQPCDSSANFCSSLQTGFDQVSFGFPEELCDGYLVQSSFQVQEQDIETHDHADLGEEIENSKNEVINQDFIETSQCELAETEDIIYKEVEEVSNNQIGRLSLSPPRSPKIIDSGCNKFEICHSDPCDLDTALQPSKSPVTNTMREKSVSPRNSPHSSSGKNGDFRKDRGRRGNRSVSKSKSRSPVRPRSSSTKRERRDRSRSPNSRHHSRRSPRRYSTSRRRSPPAPRGYHSGSRSGSDHRRTGLGRPGRNLFIAGFSFLTKEIDLEEKFSRFGRVQDVRIVRDKRSGDSRGFGFLSLERDEEADAAIRALDKTEWNGRILLVEKSKSHN